MVLTAFTDRSTVLELARLGNPDLTLDDVPQSWIDMGNEKVSMMVTITGLDPVDDVKANHDCYSMLVQAANCFCLELLNYNGKMRWSTGDLSQVKQGNFELKYQAWQPMFFFATGEANKFKNLLPHETWRMMASMFVDAFVRCYSKRQATNTYKPKIFHDDYSRGYGRENASEHYL